VLFAPVELFKEDAPTAVLLDVVLANNAFNPTATLLAPLTLAPRASCPTAVQLIAVVIASPALLPTAVFPAPVDKAKAALPTAVISLLTCAPPAL